MIDIRNWIFAGFTNQLVIEYEMVLETEDKDACTSTNVQVDSNGNVYYFTSMLFYSLSSSLLVLLLTGIFSLYSLVSSGGVSLYCQLVDTIILDERFKRAQFKIEDTNKLQVIIPHFWDRVGTNSDYYFMFISFYFVIFHFILLYFSLPFLNINIDFDYSGGPQLCSVIARQQRRLQ